jgi:hypothetical protein
VEVCKQYQHWQPNQIQGVAEKVRDHLDDFGGKQPDAESDRRVEESIRRNEGLKRGPQECIERDVDEEHRLLELAEVDHVNSPGETPDETLRP